MDPSTPPHSPREVKCPGAPKKKYPICEGCGVQYGSTEFNFMHCSGCHNSWDGHAQCNCGLY